MQQTTKRNLSILLTAASISLVSILAAQSDLPKVSPAQTNVGSIADTGDAGVVLKRLSDGTTTIQVSPHLDQKLRNNFFFSNDSFVIKIGDTYAKGKSVEELSDLLRGPVNSKVDVVFLAGDQVISKTLTRLSNEQLKDKQSFSGALLNMSDLFTRNIADSERCCQTGEIHRANGNDLIAAAYYIAAVHPPEFISPRLFDDKQKSLPAAMEFFARTGMYDEFDAAAKSLQDYLNKIDTDCDNDNCEIFTKGAEVLASNGQLDSALAIIEKFHSKFSDLSPQNKIRILKVKAIISAQKGDKEAVLQCDKELLKLCTESPQDKPEQKLEVLQELVKHFQKTGNYDLAEAAQLQVVTTVGSNGWSRIVTDQKKAAALLELSGIYDDTKDYQKERKILQQCLELYDTKLNAQEKVILERIGLICPSSVYLRLAKSYYKEGALTEASTAATSALKLMNDAIGTDNNLSLRLSALQRLSNSSDGTAESEKVIREFDDLIAVSAGLPSPPEDIDKSSFDILQSRECYDDRVKRNSRSNAILQTIINRERPRKTHTDDNLTRIINLIRLTETTGNRQRSINLLEQLNPCFESSDLKFSSTQLFQKIELATLAGTKNDAIKTDPIWQSFTAFMRETTSSGYGMPRQSTIGISYIYAFLGEPEKAFMLLKYAQSQQEVPATAYSAILYLLENNNGQAEAQFNALRASSRTPNFETINMLARLSDTFFSKGDTKQAFQILEPDFIPAHGLRDATLAERRVFFLYKLGKYQDALTASQADDKTFSYGGTPVYINPLKADLLAKTGQTNEAVLAFIKCSGGDRRGTFLHLAVLQAKKLKAPPSATIKALVEAARYPANPLTEEHVADLEYITSLARADKTSTTDTRDLELQIATATTKPWQSTARILVDEARAKKLESEGDQTATREWADVARLYFAQKNYDKGTSAMVHALQMKNGASFNGGMYHPGNLRGDLGFTILVEAKRYDDAEKILKQALIAPGKTGVAQSAFIEKALLAELYIDEGKFDEAIKWAKDVILNLEFSCDPNIKKTYIHLMDGYVFFSLVDKFIEHKQFDTAQKLIDYATKIQLSAYGPRHPLFIENYQSQTKLFLAQNKLPEAEASARKALSIEKFNGGSGNNGKESAKLLASVLRLQGRNDEADKISTSSSERPNLYNLIMQIYGGYSFHGEEPSRFLDTVEDPLKVKLGDALEYDGEGTSAYARALLDLTKFYMQRARYDDAEKLQLHQLQILDDQYGKCSKPKFVCYLYLAEIYLKKNEKGKAIKYALLIQPPLPAAYSQDDPRLELQYANVLFDIGKQTEAIAIAKKLKADLLASRGNRGLYRTGVPINDLLHFMERAGQTDDVNSLTEIINPPRHEQLTLPRIHTPPPPITPKAKEPTEAELFQKIQELSKKQTGKKALLAVQFELLNARIDADKFTELTPDLQKIQKNTLTMSEADRTTPIINLLDVSTVLIKARHPDESKAVFATTSKILDTLKTVSPQITDRLLKLSEVMADQNNLVIGKAVFAKYCSLAPLAGIDKSALEYQQFEHKPLMPPEAPDAPYKKLLAEVNQSGGNDSPTTLEDIAKLLLMELQQKKFDAKRLVPRLADGITRSTFIKFDYPLSDYLKCDVDLLYKTKQTAEARSLVFAMLQVYARDLPNNPAPTDNFYEQSTQEIRWAREEYIKLIEAHLGQNPVGLLAMYAGQLDFDVRNKFFSTIPTYTEKIIRIVKNAPDANLEAPLENFGNAGREYQQLNMITEAKKIFQTEIELDELATAKQPQKRHSNALRELAKLYQKDDWEKSKQLMLNAINIAVDTLKPVKKYLGPDLKEVVQKYLDKRELLNCDEVCSRMDNPLPDLPGNSNYGIERSLSVDFENFQNWEKAAYWMNKVVEIETEQNDSSAAIRDLKRCATIQEKSWTSRWSLTIHQASKKLEDNFRKAHGGKP